MINVNLDTCTVLPGSPGYRFFDISDMFTESRVNVAVI